MESDGSFNLFEMAQKQFDRCADLLDLEQPVREFLRLPMRETQFSLPIKLDNGESKVLRGFHVQFNDSRGPGKGGVRFHPAQTLDTIRALGMWMTWETAIVNLPLGGSASGVACDPHSLSPNEMERICRGFVRKVAHHSGPDWDVLGPDIMTGPQHMLWMLDEYEVIHGGKYPGFITGKPLSIGGSQGRKEATGYGVIFTVREALKDLKLKPQGVTASVQGFGNVAQYAVELLQQIGGTVVCVSSWDQGAKCAFSFRKKSGVSVEELRTITDPFGGIDRGKAQDLGYEVLQEDAWIEQDVDMLIPAALENQITRDNVGRIGKGVKLIAEAANGPTTSEADVALCARNMFVIPDFLANAGGVTCSYFEQVQSNMNYYWNKDEVFGKLDTTMTSAYHAVRETANKRKLTMREAAYVISISRVAQACKDRGWV
ncbi:MAG TPA: glutamate dehydrogenase [Bacteroidetes bacterium]|nr:glutamate dehydrogenase [Bacteroidota bacterium]